MNWRLLIALFVLFISIVAALNSGSADVDLWQSLMAITGIDNSAVIDPVQLQIIGQLRLPRVILAMCAGAGLAMAGVVLQTLTRNPLADPFLFGLSSGASLGAVISLVLLGSHILSMTSGAFIGAMASVFLVTLLAGNIRHASVERLLLSGVAVSFMLGALTSLILYLSEPDAVSKMLFWMLGSFSAASWSMLTFPVVALLLCGGIFLVFSNYFNAMLSGEETALTLGIDVSRFRFFMLLICSLLTAVIVANCGGIGFVGLMIPHIVRKLVGARTQNVLLYSALIGASFMLWVDLLARNLMENQIVPIGVLTSILGSFFFFVILKIKSSKQGAY